MTNAELVQYKRYLQKYVFAGWEAPDDLKEWVRMLERHILHADMQAEEEPGVTATDDTVDPKANSPEHPYGRFADRLAGVHLYHDRLHCDTAVTVTLPFLQQTAGLQQKQLHVTMYCSAVLYKPWKSDCSNSDATNQPQQPTCLCHTAMKLSQQSFPCISYHHANLFAVNLSPCAHSNADAAQHRYLGPSLSSLFMLLQATLVSHHQLPIRATGTCQKRPHTPICSQERLDA